MPARAPRTKKPNVFRLTMTSDPKNVHRVERFLLKMNAVAKISDERFSTLLVVMTEAVNNAIIHGNKRNHSKHVFVTCTIKGGDLVATVKDEGDGFDPSGLPDPVHEDNLLRESGRGVFLMRQLMESVRYNARGNEVTMRMQL